MKHPALTTWSVFDGQKVSNAHPVIKSAIHGIFKLDHAYWNVVSVDTKLVLQRVLLCIERGSLCQSGFGPRTW